VNSRTLRDGQVVIPPGETVTLTFQCGRVKPGRYHVQFPLYTDAPGQGIITLTIDGEFYTAPTDASPTAQSGPGVSPRQ
jgi:hypothetical protein